VFEKPGTYATGPSKQKTSFAKGTVYFRHGAKSEPGNTEDIRKALERRLEIVRRSWMKGVRKVVQAPTGSRIITVTPGESGYTNTASSAFRVVKDKNAAPVRFTRDPTESSGIFLHEELSDGIFDEINNIIDANKVLTKGKKRFLFGESVYYRIYAERKYVQQPKEILDLLAQAAFMSLYCPGLYWFLNLPAKACADILAYLYRTLTHPYVYNLIRIALLLGDEFSKWLFDKFQKKWRKHPQPPTFFWSFKETIRKLSTKNKTLLALRLSPSSPVNLPNDQHSMTANELLIDPDRSSKLLSRSCMLVFDGNKQQIPIARRLDYLTYGRGLEKRASEIVRATLLLIGSEKPGEMLDN
jgi:hypothetical protein